MPDIIELNPEKRIIEIRSYGTVEVGDIENSIKLITKINEQSGVDKVLVDTTEQESMPSTFREFSIFSELPRNIFRVALLANQEQPTFEDIRFVETVAQNRGIQMQVFNTRKEALEWLEEGN